MKVKDVSDRVEEIRRMRDDDEAAHSGEDDLWEDVLRAIAKDGRNASKLAREALRTCRIKFSRWCA